LTTGFERDRDEFARGARAVIVLPDRGDAARDADARLAETAGLAEAIGVTVVEKLAIRLRAPKPATLIGSGQAEALAATVRMEEAGLVVFDAALTPVQQRNLETALDAKVIDRTGLILEIFGERAATAEGRLQVELAHLDYQAGRLVRSWTHLERQRGGFGFLGGPGETQIEADRRLIRDRMARLRKELDQVSRTRGLHRDRRQRAPWPVIALVGYTNAGKSTLFNRLTGADVMAEDLLFATLDPTLRQISLPGIDKVILSDTVGFVSELPTQLVAAFKATLEEVVSADLLIHIRDIAHPDSDAQRADVEKVLRDIGVADTTPRIEAWNKLDLLHGEEREDALAHAVGRSDVVAISAIGGEGVDTLIDTVATLLTEAHRRYRIAIDQSDGASAAWLHQHGEVLGQESEGDQAIYDVRMAERDYERFNQRSG
jgi:GTP-binding protein HflX